MIYQENNMSELYEDLYEDLYQDLYDDFFNNLARKNSSS